MDDNRRATLVRRGWVAAFDAGQRPLPPADRVLRWGRPVFLPLSSLTCVRTDRRVLAITYDDGPDPASTAAVLDELARRQVTATFFVLVDRAEKEPDLVRRIVAEGHEIGLHGEDHAALSELPVREALRRIRRGKHRLERLLGRPVRLFRPTYGAQRMGAFVGTRLLGMQVVIWTAWAQDWTEDRASEVAARALAAVHPGAFLLMHDCLGDRDPAGPPDLLDRPEVTRLLLDGLIADGYQTATVGELLASYPAIRSVWAERGSAMS